MDTTVKAYAFGTDAVLGEEFDVFISYSHAEPDKSIAEAIAAVLKNEGYSVWWDRSLMGGEDWPQDLEQRVRFARRVVALVSERSLNSKWCHGEVWLASNTPGKLLPVVLEDCELPLHLSRIQALKWNGNPELDKANLLTSIHMAPNGRLRDRALAVLVKELAADNPGLTPITSRQLLPELMGINAPRVINHPLDSWMRLEGWNCSSISVSTDVSAILCASISLSEIAS